MSYGTEAPKHLRLGSKAPDFTADAAFPVDKGTTQLNLYDYIGDGWLVFFSHPADFTPVCTTELGSVANLSDEFKKRNVKVLGLSANSLEEHRSWIEDINKVNKQLNDAKARTVDFPIVADPKRTVSLLYDMLDHQDVTNVDAKGIPLTVRSVFFIDPKKIIRAIITYPAQTGRNFTEVLRVIDSLQIGDKERVTTPANWQVGDDVIIHPSVTKDEADKLFSEYNTLTPYLRLTNLKKKKVY